MSSNNSGGGNGGGGERRTITINPDFLKLSGSGGTRKRRKKTDTPADPTKPIKIKTNTKPKPSVSTLKKNILNMIRRHQDDKYKSGVRLESKMDDSSAVQKFNSEFEDSLQFLSSLPKHTDEKKMDTSYKNHTIRNNVSMPLLSSVPPVLNHSFLAPSEMPMNQLQGIGQGTGQPSSTPVFIKPQYGCLKNGSLPTYRIWKNKTQRQYPPLPQSSPFSNIPPNIQSTRKPEMTLPVSLNTQMQEQKLKQDIQELSRMKQLKQKQEPMTIIRPCKPRQKRILRRTYHVGKSKLQPRVTVLVSNKTIRAQTNLKSQELKQTPIQDVKKYLLKHGFIKVGTSSPNDVLRKMYESAKLICGEIHNHNPENLLYNYFNDIK